MNPRYRLHILLIRLSALGDAAILQPVLRQRAEENPDVLFSLAGPPLLAPLFAGIDNIHYLPTPKRQSPREIYNQLEPLMPGMVADMHHVLRTIGVCWLFRMDGVPVRSIRKRIPRSRPAWQRYDDVLRRCGLKGDPLPSDDYFHPHPSADGLVRIGIAPFAQHRGKCYPLALMEQVVERLSRDARVRILLFGSRDEAPQMQPWAERFPNVENHAGKHSFEEELHLMSTLSTMLSMDSSNMHFASCLGIPVVSVWGATHPCRGFYGWRQDPANAVQLNLPCRPCSKYGKKPCRYGDYRCLSQIAPAEVVARLRSVAGLGGPSYERS